MVRLGVKLRNNDIERVLDICLRNEQLDDLQNFIKHMEASNTPISEKLLTPLLVFAGRRANPEFTLQVQYNTVSRVCGGACVCVCRGGAILTLMSVQLKEKYMHAGCTRNAAHTAYESLIRSQANAVRFPEAFKVFPQHFFPSSKFSVLINVCQLRHRP